MEVERIVVRLFADAAPYQRTLSEAEKSLLGFAGRAGFIGQLLDLPIKMATVSAIGLTAAMGASGLAAVKLAADYETVGVALEVMTGSAEKGKNLLDQINKLAVETPFKSSGLQAAAKELAAFGIETEQIMPTLRALGDVASGVATGNLDEMMSRIVLAFGQVRTAGRLMGPEARQFVQAGVPIYDALAKVMGKPVEMMKLLTEEGKVGFGDVVKAFNLMTSEGGRFFNMMERQSQTVRGRWSALVETIELGLRDVGLAAFEGLGLKDFLETLRGLTDQMRSGDGSQLVNFFKNIKEFFIDISRVARATFYWIEKAWYATRDWARENREVVEFAGRVLVTAVAIAGTVKLISMGWAAVAGTIGLLVSPLGQLLIAATAITAALKLIGEFGGLGTEQAGRGFGLMLKNLGEGFSTIGKSLSDALLGEDWDLVGKIIFKGIEIGFKSLMATIVVEIGHLAGLLGIAFAEFFDRQWKIMKSFKDNLKDLFDPTVSDELATQRQQQRRDQITRDVAAVYDAERAKLAASRDRTIEGVMAPFRQELAVLKHQAAEARRAKEDPVGFQLDKIFEANRNLETFTDEWLARMMHVGQQTFGPGFDPFSKDPRIQQFGKDYALSVSETLMNKVWDQLGLAGLERMMRDNVNPQMDLAARQLAAFRITFDLFFGKSLDDAAENLKRNREKMAAPITYRPEVMELAADIRREMAKEQTKGIGFGAGQFTAFQKTFDLLEEGFRGPMGRLTGLDNVLPMGVGNFIRALGPRGAINEDQYRFGLFREFSNLRRWVGGGAGDRLPPTAMLGSTEAQDIINRSRLMETDRMQEMVQVLKAAEELERQQKEIMERETKLLEEISNKLNGRGFNR